MKICLINNLFFGGHYAEVIAAGLSKENEVVAITTKPFSGLSSLKPSIERRNNMKIYSFYPLNVYRHYPVRYRPLWMRMIWHLVEIWNPHPYFIIKKILKEEKPDIVHTINLIGMSTSVYTAVNHSGYSHVHTICDGALISPWANLLRDGKMISFNLLDRLFINIKRRLSKSVNVVIAISRFMRDIHLQNGYLKNTACYVIDYPYRINPVSRKKKSYSPISILFVGTIVYDKGIYVLLDAFKKLGRNDVNLHYVGMGPDTDELRKKAHGIDNIYIHGYVTDDELVAMYNRTNITVVPSLCYEAGPAAAFLESIPFGTPTIGSNRGAIPEGIIDGVNGRLFEPGDSSALRDIMQDLIDNKDKLKKMEHEVLKLVDEYQPEKYTANLMEVYRSLKRGSALQAAPGTGRY